MTLYPSRPLLNVDDRSQTYIPRPGAYGVVFNEKNQILLLKEQSGYFLPGGGQDPGESMYQALKREFQEELRCEVQNAWPLMAADDCRWSPFYKQHFQIQGHYYWVDLDLNQNLIPEQEVEICWTDLPHAEELLTRENETWLLRQLFGEFRLLSHWDSTYSQQISYLCQQAYELENDRIQASIQESDIESVTDIVASSDCFWGAFQDEQLIALISANLQAQPVEITRLVVKPELEGQGIGTQILERFIHFFGGVELSVKCASKNDRGLSLYKQAGFIERSEGVTSDGVPYLILLR